MRESSAERLDMRSSLRPVGVAISAILLGLLWISLSTGTAFACKCAPPGSAAEELEKSAAVFAGRVMSIHHSYDPEGKSVTPEDRSTIGFRVSTVWKGEVHETMYITTPPTGGSCGFRFAEREEYVVYAHDSHYDDDSYTVSICSRTALLENAQEDLDALGQGEAPQAGTKGPMPEPERVTVVGWSWDFLLSIMRAVLSLVGFRF